VSKRSLKRLAKSIFELARREIWLGGKVVEYSGKPGLSWPANIEVISWPRGLTWTFSPEVELGGAKLRLCISWSLSELTPYVRIFVDGEVKHPGGKFTANLFWGDGWIRRIAKQARAACGKTGPVDTRDLLLAEAENKSKGVLTTHDKPPVYCDLCHEAIKEIEKDFPAAEQVKLLEHE
jgi:hypothetical protein